MSGFPDDMELDSEWTQERAEWEDFFHAEMGMAGKAYMTQGTLPPATPAGTLNQVQHCGNITYIVNGEPQWKVSCHCNWCQTTSGAAFRTFVLLCSGGRF